MCVCVRSSVSAGLDRRPEQPLTGSAASPATGLSARLRIREVRRDLWPRARTSAVHALKTTAGQKLPRVTTSISAEM